ncbi:MAG: transcription elongation factor GreA [Candidatus Shapirobacteria bacterium]|nr:transcription elongation factor GreA [Candidatus Shapirobacteria bacterium]
MDKKQEKIPLTKIGLEKLKKEYKELDEVKRPAVLERLNASRKIGEFDEDSDFSQAKQEVSFIDGRMSELEEIISNGVLIDEGHNNCQEIKLGCQIMVESNGQEKTFHLVGEWEANPVEAKISYQSPLGQSLLGKKIGDKIEVSAPAGKIIYTIKKID